MLVPVARCDRWIRGEYAHHTGTRLLEDLDWTDRRPGDGETIGTQSDTGTPKHSTTIEGERSAIRINTSIKPSTTNNKSPIAPHPHCAGVQNHTPAKIVRTFFHSILKPRPRPRPVFRGLRAPRTRESFASNANNVFENPECRNLQRKLPLHYYFQFLFPQISKFEFEFRI